MRRAALVVLAMTTAAPGCKPRPLPPAPPPVAVDEPPPPPKPSATASARAAPKPRPPTESGYQRWRIAIEVFVPRATPGASIALDRERSEEFTKYIAKLHEKVHPVFSRALVPLDDLGDKDALKNLGLSTEVELAIDGATGRVAKYGVARRSEVVDFDALALDAIRDASPFDPAPEGLRSPDGNVYVRWVFRRDPNDGCSTRGAKGYVLRKAPWPP